MKANAPKRKVFQDAVDLISPPEEAVNPVVNGQAMIPVETIVPFHDHPFRLYEGKRLDDIVESIREHGILIPVIVQKIADGYEMLSGHNRWNAAKIAGIKEIPAIIKENLTEREAYVYVIETNMLQCRMRCVQMAGQEGCFSFMVQIVPADGLGVSSSYRTCHRTTWKIWKKPEVWLGMEIMKRFPCCMIPCRRYFQN